MPSINSISVFTEFSPRALARRQKQWNLGPDPSCRDLLQLKPLSGRQEKAMSLEEARTEDARQAARLKRQKADEADGVLCDYRELQEQVERLFGSVSSTIRSSTLPESAKAQLFDDIREAIADWSEPIKERRAKAGIED